MPVARPVADPNGDHPVSTSHIIHCGPGPSTSTQVTVSSAGPSAERPVPAAHHGRPPSRRPSASVSYVDEAAIVDDVLRALADRDVQEITDSLRSALGTDKAREVGHLLADDSVHA